MMRKMSMPGWDVAPSLSPNTLARLQRHLPIVIAVLFGLSGAAAISAVMAPGLPALIFLGGAVAVGLVVVYGHATGALSSVAAPQFGDLAIRIVEDVPEAYLVTRRDGSVVFANTAYRQLTAYLGDERPGPLERLLAGQEEAAQPLYKLARAAREGAEAREDVPIDMPGGAGRTWLQVEVRPVSGFRHRVLWRIVDRGPEREAGEAKQMLQLERDSLIRALDHLPVGLITFDGPGTVVWANRTAGSLGGRGARALGGARLDTVFAGSEDEIRDCLREAAEADNPIELALRRVDPDQEHREAEPLRVWVRARTDMAADSSPVLHLALWPRRADGAQAEDLPANSLSEFLDHAPMGIVILDEEGAIQVANPAMRKMMDAQGADARTIEDLIQPDDRDVLSTIVQQLRLDRADKDGIEVRLAGSGGPGSPARSAQIFVSRLDPVPGGDGHLILYFVDTTHQKNLEQQFAQSQKMQAIGQLAGGVAHDFNNLLTAIIGFSDLLVSRHPAGDPSFGDINQIKQNALRAANLTRQLLAFSRRQTLRPKVLQLTDVLAELSILLRRLIGETIKLDIRHGRNLGLVKVDQGQLEQVIINLAVNARDAMAEGGTLTIRTANKKITRKDGPPAGIGIGQDTLPPGAYVEITVADTGVGIPPENLTRIFEPFFTTKTEEGAGKGTGLGLATVIGIIHQTGGYMFLDSEVGRGTTFRIYLPRDAKAEAAPTPVAAKADKPRDLTGKGTILLVEDEDAVRTFAARALTSRGYNVLEAAHGEQALEVAGGHNGAIDLVVSDVVMPVMDGPTMAGQLLQMRPGTKIVFISGYAETAFQNSVGAPDDFTFLPKPFTLKQLAQTVKDVLG